MDHLLHRVDALEQQLHTLQQHTHMVTRRLRWWRGLACAFVILGLVGLPWYGVKTQAQEQADEEVDTQALTLAQRVAVLESKLRFVRRSGRNLFITGANLHIRNGLGSTDCTAESNEPIPDCPNGLGNLIVGYNELRGFEDIRTGSHNVVVGQGHNFSRVGGLVVGESNEISGDFAVVSGGRFSTASGKWSAVSGGESNDASGELASISGGARNDASGIVSSVSGGGDNTASGIAAAVSGGQRNTASAEVAVVSGGEFNTASGDSAVVSGGVDNTASAEVAVVSGGQRNTASGNSAVVSGGHNRTAEGVVDWVAGGLFQEQ